MAINGDCVFFNHLNSRKLTDPGKYIKVQPQSEWIVNGPDIPCKIIEISDSPLQTSKTECVIYLRNGKQNALDGHVEVGQTINVRQKMVKSNWGNVPENILNAFHGYPSIAHDGVLHEGEYNNFENGREYENSSHVMVGISKDKTKMYVCINEMSAQSKPINCVEMATWMLKRGAWGYCKLRQWRFCCNRSQRKDGKPARQRFNKTCRRCYACSFTCSYMQLLTT